MQPKVSIVVPVYNVERYVGECLDSIVNQTLRDIQIIVVNDGSTDGSKAICDKYAAADPRVTVIDKPNGGYGHSMNRGFAAATGEYIGIVESDDCASPRMFEALYNLAKKTDADMVRSNYWTMTGSGERQDLINILSVGNTPYNMAFDPADYVEILRGSPAIWTGIYKASFLRESGIDFLETPGASYQDTGFFLKVCTLAKRVAFTREAFLNYRVDNANSSVKSGAKVFCVSDEYASFEKMLAEHPSRMKAFSAMIPAKKWETYLWNYNRLDDSLKGEFMALMTNEFGAYRASGMLKREMFSVAEWREVQQVIDSPESLAGKELSVVGHRGTALNHALTIYCNRIAPKLANGDGSDSDAGELAGAGDDENGEGAKPADIVRDADDSERGPLVSIVVPVYNSAVYLPDMFDSLLAQTYSNLQIICVNDGSADNSLQVLNDYAAKDGRIVVIDKPNSGASETRNAGIAAATGEYLCFVDSDDFIELDAIEHLVAAALESGADAVLYDLDYYLDEQGGFESQYHAINRDVVPAGMTFRASSIEHFYKNVIGYTVNKMYRTSLITGDNITFPKVGAHEDMPFTYVALSAANGIYFLDEVLYHYRRGREGSLSDDTNEQYRYMIQALVLFREMLAERGLWEENERNFVNYALHMCCWKINETRFSVAKRFREDCRDEFFEELGIAGKDPAYFYRFIERKYYEWISKDEELPFWARRGYNACKYVKNGAVHALSKVKKD